MELQDISGSAAIKEAAAAFKANIDIIVGGIKDRAGIDIAIRVGEQFKNLITATANEFDMLRQEKDSVIAKAIELVRDMEEKERIIAAMTLLLLRDNSMRVLDKDAEGMQEDNTFAGLTKRVQETTWQSPLWSCDCRRQ